MSSKIVHKYQLYVWHNRSNKYVMCIEYSTLKKIKEFYSEAINVKEGKIKNYYSKRSWNARYIVKNADLSRYYIRHIEIKVEQTILKDEEIKEKIL